MKGGSIYGPHQNAQAVCAVQTHEMRYFPRSAVRCYAYPGMPGGAPGAVPWCLKGLPAIVSVRPSCLIANLPLHGASVCLLSDRTNFQEGTSDVCPRLRREGGLLLREAPCLEVFP